VGRCRPAAGCQQEPVGGTGGARIYLHKPDAPNLDMAIDVNDDGTLQTPLGETVRGPSCPSYARRTGTEERAQKASSKRAGVWRLWRYEAVVENPADYGEMNALFRSAGRSQKE
jgi:hypothetical protein